jgi:hypothetical protein
VLTQAWLPPFPGGEIATHFGCYAESGIGDKESFYFAGNQGRGEFTYLRARFYFEKFHNILRAYDNACY